VIIGTDKDEVKIAPMFNEVPCH